MSSSSLARWIPSLTCLRVYDRTWLRSDVIAGITLAAYLRARAFTNADQLIALDPRTDCQKRH